MKRFLTKSLFVQGLSCPRLLWCLVHNKHNLPKPTISELHRMHQGVEVGVLATQLFSNGVDVCGEKRKDWIKNNLEQTKTGMEKRIPLFEAGFVHDQLYARVDILVPVEDNKWDIIEVKSSTKVKEEHVYDVAFQRHVLKNAGVNIRNCYLLHLNREYVKEGKIDLTHLFTKTNITDDVNAIVDVPEQIKKMLQIIDKKKSPQTFILDECENGLKCLCSDCYDFLPENNVFTFYRINKKKARSFAKSYGQSITDVPEYELTARQKIQRKTAVENKSHVNQKHIKQFLDKLTEPIQYVDFEAFQTAVPMFDGTKPYQQIPFQFSLHVEEKGKVKHHSFIAEPDSNIQLEFGKALKKVLKPKGSIVVYNASFEKGRLKELAQQHPKEFAEWVEAINKHIVDLLVPFRNFDYYDKKQEGSASIKKVLPVLTDLSYKGLKIADGDTAAIHYLQLVLELRTDKSELFRRLEKYCALDTESMVLLVEELRKV